MKLSIIVASEADVFDHKQRDFLASFARQTHPHNEFELIYVDGNGRASTAEVCRTFAVRYPSIRISYLASPSPARAYGNNLGAARASGELLVFLADDFDPSPGFVAAHAEYHALNADPNAAGIGPAFFPEELRTGLFARWYEDSGALFGIPMRSALAIWPRKFFYAGNASIKKEKFDELGGFEEAFRHEAWDDFEFGLRFVESGGYTQFITAATTIHRHCVSLEERCLTMARAGQAARVLEALHPNIPHGWKSKLSVSQAPLAAPGPNAPPHTRIGYFSRRLDQAFARGYLTSRTHGEDPCPGSFSTLQSQCSRGKAA